MYVPVKTRGPFHTPIERAPRFRSRDEADCWLRAFLQKNPETLRAGLEGACVKFYPDEPASKISAPWVRGR